MASALAVIVLGLLFEFFGINKIEPSKKSTWRITFYIILALIVGTAVFVTSLK